MADQGCFVWKLAAEWLSVKLFFLMCRPSDNQFSLLIQIYGQVTSGLTCSSLLILQFHRMDTTIFLKVELFHFFRKCIFSYQRANRNRIGRSMCAFDGGFGQIVGLVFLQQRKTLSFVCSKCYAQIWCCFWRALGTRSLSRFSAVVPAG